MNVSSDKQIHSNLKVKPENIETNLCIAQQWSLPFLANNNHGQKLNVMKNYRVGAGLVFNKL